MNPETVTMIPHPQDPPALKASVALTANDYRVALYDLVRALRRQHSLISLSDNVRACLAAAELSLARDYEPTPHYPHDLAA